MNILKTTCMICNHFISFLGCHFSLFIVSFDAQKFLILAKPNLYDFSFVVCALLSYPKSHCQVQSHEDFSLCFKSFKVFFKALDLF